MPDTTPVSDKTYETLTDRQQALIDELARERVDGLDRTREQIVKDAADGEPFEPYAVNYTWTVQDKYGDIIDERADAILNDHASVERGNVSVEGAVDISDPEEWPKPQTIGERPVKTGELDLEPKVTVTLDLETAREVLAAADVPEAHREAVFEAVVEL